MKYLLDTNVLIAMFRGQYQIREQMVKAGFSDCAVSEITLGEILTGCYKGGFEKHAHEIQFLKEHFVVLPISPAIDLYGQVRAQLELQGIALDSMDLLIGCTALADERILVTHNIRHFERIPGLRIEDWEKKSPGDEG